jgi:hypothetical protein
LAISVAAVFAATVEAMRHERMVGNQPTASSQPNPEIVVFMVRRETHCSECGRKLWHGSLLRLENEKALCLDCADLGHLEYLPRGDVAVTRRASKYTRLRAVVLEWSRTRKRYERQGILAEPEAIRRAEEESLGDAELRERRREQAAARRVVEDHEFVAAFARAIRSQFPGCPAGEETKIAEHACQKYSGRVGRSAAAQHLDSEAVRLAVIAHIRHALTDYDLLLNQFGDRMLARGHVRDLVDEILQQWHEPAR